MQGVRRDSVLLLRWPGREKLCLFQRCTGESMVELFDDRVRHDLSCGRHSMYIRNGTSTPNSSNLPLAWFSDAFAVYVYGGRLKALCSPCRGYAHPVPATGFFTHRECVEPFTVAENHCAILMNNPYKMFLGIGTVTWIIAQLSRLVITRTSHIIR